MTTATSTPKFMGAAVPFLGILAAIQGTCPNIASTALVGASKSLDMAGSTQALAASVQTLAVAASVITTGFLADRLGRRRVLMVALVVGAVGNLIVMAAPSAAVYMLGMVVTGVGLGAVYSCAFASMKAVVPAERMAGALGIFTASLMVATLVLTFVGGALTTNNWRIGFLLLPIISMVCLVLTPMIVPTQVRVSGNDADLPGQALIALGVISFLYGVSQFGNSLTSPGTVVPLLLGVALMIGFYLRERSYEGHFYPVDLLHSPVFLAALAVGFVYTFGTAVLFLQVTNLWQYVNGLATSEVAVWQLPLVGSGVISALLIGRLMATGMTNRVAAIIGSALTAAGMVLLGVFQSSTSLVGFLPGLILGGAGVVVCAVPFGNLILREAPPNFLGPVTSSRTTFGQFFYTLGFSLSTVMVDRLTRGGIIGKLRDAGVPANQISTGIDAVQVYASRGTQPSTSLGKEALGDGIASYGQSFAATMYVSAAAVVVAGVIVMFLLRHGEGTPQPLPQADPGDPATAPA
ncbi:MAG: MFS transporter [Actinomycetota bacterium]